MTKRPRWQRVGMSVVGIGILALTTTACLSKNDHGVNVTVQHVRKDIRPHQASMTADVIYRNNTGSTKTATCKLIVGVIKWNGDKVTKAIPLRETVGPYGKARDHIKEHIRYSSYDRALDPKLAC